MAAPADICTPGHLRPVALTGVYVVGSPRIEKPQTKGPMKLAKILSVAILTVFGLASCGGPEEFHATDTTQTTESPLVFTGTKAYGSRSYSASVNGLTVSAIPSQTMSCTDGGGNVGNFMNGQTKITIELNDPNATWVAVTMVPPFGSGELAGSMYARHFVWPGPAAPSWSLPYPNQSALQSMLGIPPGQTTDVYLVQNFLTDNPASLHSYAYLIPGVRAVFDDGATQNPVVNGNAALLGNKSAFGLYMSKNNGGFVATGYVWLDYGTFQCQVYFTSPFFPM